MNITWDDVLIIDRWRNHQVDKPTIFHITYLDQSLICRSEHTKFSFSPPFFLFLNSIINIMDVSMLFSLTAKIYSKLHPLFL